MTAETVAQPAPLPVTDPQVQDVVTDVLTLDQQIEEAEARLTSLRKRRAAQIAAVVDLVRDRRAAAEAVGLSRQRLEQLRDGNGQKILPRAWENVRVRAGR